MTPLRKGFNNPLVVDHPERVVGRWSLGTSPHGCRQPLDLLVDRYCTVCEADLRPDDETA
ncbi:MAG: hypothetical protein ACRDWA_01135 [Acidimicrobiia bacterium]